jgi:hypothetical protein
MKRKEICPAKIQISWKKISSGLGSLFGQQNKKHSHISKGECEL